MVARGGSPRYHGVGVCGSAPAASRWSGSPVATSTTTTADDGETPISIGEAFARTIAIALSTSAWTPPRVPRAARCQLAEQLAVGGEPLRVDAQRAGEFALRDHWRIETEQPRAAFRHANRRRHSWRASRSDLRPQAGGHLVEALKLQIPKLLGLFDGLSHEARRVPPRRPRARCARRRRAAGQSRDTRRPPSVARARSRDARRSSRPGRGVRDGVGVARLWRCPLVCGGRVGVEQKYLESVVVAS